MFLKSSLDQERECVFIHGEFGCVNCGIPFSMRGRHSDQHSMVNSSQGKLTKYVDFKSCYTGLDYICQNMHPFIHLLP